MATAMNERPMTHEISGPSLNLLMIWLSPAFPIGAFSYSHGLEWAVEKMSVSNREAVEAWILDLIELGSIRLDTKLMIESYLNTERTREWGGLASALSGGKERHLETSAQGQAFLKAIKQNWPKPELDSTPDDLAIALPVAVGLAGAVHQLPLASLAQAYLLSQVQNLVSAAVRLIPLGQTDGLKLLCELEPVINRVSADLLAHDFDETGSASLRSEIAALSHETQYTRLFRT